MTDGQRFRLNQHRIRPKHQRHADMFEQHAMLRPDIQIGARQSKPQRTLSTANGIMAAFTRRGKGFADVGYLLRPVVACVDKITNH